MNSKPTEAKQARVGDLALAAATIRKRGPKLMSLEAVSIIDQGRIRHKS